MNAASIVQHGSAQQQKDHQIEVQAEVPDGTEAYFPSSRGIQVIKNELEIIIVAAFDSLWYSSV